MELNDMCSYVGDSVKAWTIHETLLRQIQMDFYFPAIMCQKIQLQSNLCGASYSNTYHEQMKQKLFKTFMEASLKFY